MIDFQAYPSFYISFERKKLSRSRIQKRIEHGPIFVHFVVSLPPIVGVHVLDLGLGQEPLGGHAGHPLLRRAVAHRVPGPAGVARGSAPAPAIVTRVNMKEDTCQYEGRHVSI